MEAIRELLVTDRGAAKLARREISDGEVEQLLRNASITVRNPRAKGKIERRLLIGQTNGGRALTLVIERTVEPSAWLVITGWTATAPERRLLEKS